MPRFFASIALSLLAFPNIAAAAIPQKINFQGRLTDSSGNAVTGTKSVAFSIWDSASGGSELWTETQSVTVSTGIYNVTLGSTTDISTNVFSTQNAWLQVKVGSDSPMTPRVRVAAVPYAFVAQQTVGLTSFLPVDDLFTLQPLNTYASLSSPYTVPAGKNLVGSIEPARICDYDSNVWWNGVSYTTYTYGGKACFAPISGAHTATTAVSRNSRGSILILGEGDVISSTASAISHSIRAVLVPNRVTVIVQDIASGGFYTVPAGKSFYFMVVATVKGCMGTLNMNGFITKSADNGGGILSSGETLVNNMPCTATLMGYLK